MNIFEQYKEAEQRLVSASMFESSARMQEEKERWTAEINRLKWYFPWYVYDIESYPNFFCLTIKHIASGHRWIFEVSDWYNDSVALIQFLYRLKEAGARTVGFNNIGYDYVVLHNLVKYNSTFTAQDAYHQSQQIFANQGNRFGSMIWESDHIFEQIDLFKIHHFDNMAKATGLKALEFAMRSHSIEDLPYDPNVPIDTNTREQADKIIYYNCHDVNETEKFFHHSIDMVRFRDELSIKLSENYMNFNDTKIGKEYFIRELEKAVPGICFTRKNGRKEPRQTPRTSIALRDVILPEISFETAEFNRVLEYLKTVTITDTKSAPELKNLSAKYGDFQFDFGTGGIHGSVSNKRIISTPGRKTKDADVASYYPNLGIVNGFYPEHLSNEFCKIYADLYKQRSAYAKKTAENEMLKLALNGVYGDSNNPYSPFYDPAYTMKITINGQLLLCMLAEWLMTRVPTLEMIQINTDGMTVSYDPQYEHLYTAICDHWQKFTRLTLEFVDYSAMYIRDVNNYISVATDGKIKRKGAYSFVRPDEKNKELGWHQNHSGLVIQKAASAALIDGVDITDFINRHTDPYDFMMRAKAPRTSRLVLDGGEAFGLMSLQNTTRYTIARSGWPLVKVMPPLLKNPEKERRIGIDVGWLVAPCNKVEEFEWENLNRDYYIKEALKLVEILK